MEIHEKNSNENSQIFEENSGLILENIFIPKIKLQKIIENGNIIKLSGLDQIRVISKDESRNNYIFIVFYSISNDLNRYDDVNKRYAIWNITDLRDNKCRLYLFGEVFEELQNETIGHLYLIINPSVITSDLKNCKSYLSISKINQVIKVGKVKGFGICKGINKNGTICTNPIDSNYQGPLCKYHGSFKSKENSKKNLNGNLLIFSSMIKNGRNELIHTESTENMKIDAPKHNSNENKIHYRRLVKQNLNKSEYFSINEESKRTRTDYIEDILKKNEIFDLNNKLNNAIKENNTSEVLIILRYLSNFDTSNTTLDQIIKSGIIYSISNLELKTTEIETAIFALKVRHKFCNSKGYWPRIVTEEPDEHQNLKVLETHLDLSWKNIHKKISSFEEEISEKKMKKDTDLLLGITKTKKQIIKKQSSNLNNVISKIDKVVSLNTSCDDAIRKLENSQLKKKLIELEEADNKAEFKRNINSIKILNAIKCKKCGIWTEGNANPVCKEEHPESIIFNQSAIKESWLCKSCNERIYSINGYLNPYCPKCKADTVCNLKRNSIYKLKTKFPNLNETLLIRNGETMGEMERIDLI
ncbi:uncharacterized protein cubi_02296 [Cryptosporidium ubiquitum]|uniref:Uncharacterized protein n=1 Tax=Cryptosporidium ubiquitum TaxID=857276 RepID=A0A1J4MFT2_9CRYT|nr:uncharacterized protein cubi_02296 [Cryptosporidium ubiquitum]OII73065.1 hypothetical protein cubi_02296 [Cryptosporidium ubiquitum]